MTDTNTHRICERCWFDGLTGTTPEGSYRQPAQVTDAEPGACCTCGGMTITGIYHRALALRLRCKGRHDDLSWSRVEVTREERG